MSGDGSLLAAGGDSPVASRGDFLGAAGGGSLVAAGGDEPASAWAGVWIAEDIELIAQGVQSRSWVDGTLGVAGAGLDGLALVSDPVGALLQYGISWLIEHVRPLSEALDWLAGDPGQIAAHAQTWRNVAGSLRAESDALASAVRADLTGWHGAAADAYQRWAAQRDQSLQTLARASDTMALITEGAGTLIGTVRTIVRDAVATVVSRLIVYAGELIATAGLATPLVAEQVSTLCASWAAKIARWLRALIASIRNLLREAARLGELIKKLIEGLRRSGQSQGRTGPPQRQGTEPHEHRPKHEPRDPPDFRHADVSLDKIANYAMSPVHPVGRHKYRVIHAATGLEAKDAQVVQEQIREGVRSGIPIPGNANEYGQRWTVDVPLTGPTGMITVTTAWIVDVGGTSPRLISISFPRQA